MKKIGVLVAVLCAALVVVGCTSLPSASEGMASAKNKAPEGAVVGQATGSSLKQAEDSAKSQIARAMTFIVKDMVDAAVAAGKIQQTAADDFRAGVNTTMRNSGLPGTQKVESGEGKGKQFYAVYYMEKADVVKVINSAVTAAKAQHPQAASFTTDGIDAAYRTYSAREWKSGN